MHTGETSNDITPSNLEGGTQPDPHNTGGGTQPNPHTILPAIHINDRPLVPFQVSRAQATSPRQEQTIRIRDDALDVWRAARSAYSMAFKLEARSESQNTMAEEGMLPRWALGLEPLPEYFLPLEDEIVTLVKDHAKQLLQKTAHAMARKAVTLQTKGQALLTAVDNIYDQDLVGRQEARALLESLVDRDRESERAKLQKRRHDLLDRPVLDTEIARANRAGPSLTQQAPALSAAPPLRGRSRSPRRRMNNFPKGRLQGHSGRGRSASRRDRTPHPGQKKHHNGGAKNRRQGHAAPPQRQNTSLTQRELQLVQEFRRLHMKRH